MKVIHKFYFSTEGSDVADGSIYHPFASVSKLIELIHSLPTTDTVNIFFCRGDKWYLNTDIDSMLNRLLSKRPNVTTKSYGHGSYPIFVTREQS